MGTLHLGPPTSPLYLDAVAGESLGDDFGTPFGRKLLSVGGSSYFIYFHWEFENRIGWMESALLEVVDGRLELVGFQPKVEWPPRPNNPDEPFGETVGDYLGWGDQYDAWYLGEDPSGNLYFAWVTEGNPTLDATFGSDTAYVGILKFNNATNRFTNVSGTDPWLRASDAIEVQALPLTDGGLDGTYLATFQPSTPLFTFLDGRLYLAYAVENTNFSPYRQALLVSRFDWSGDNPGVLAHDFTKVVTSNTLNTHPRHAGGQYGDIVLGYFSAHGDHILATAELWNTGVSGAELLGVWRVEPDGTVAFTDDLDPSGTASFWYGTGSHVDNGNNTHLYDGSDLLYRDNDGGVRLFSVGSTGVTLVSQDTGVRTDVFHVMGSPRGWIEVGSWTASGSMDFNVYPFTMDGGGLTTKDPVLVSLEPQSDMPFMFEDSWVGMRSPSNNEVNSVVLVSRWQEALSGIVPNGEALTWMSFELVEFEFVFDGLETGPQDRRMTFKRNR